MVEILLKKNALEEPIELNEFCILEELPETEEEYQIVRVKVEEKPVKRALRKLLKKAMYNPKYLEETYTIDEAKRKIYLKTYGFF
ncbi:MAG: hypothetical protein ACFFCI_08495 [Promethearchaeota archaeon]